jgi:hypothetical protein
MEYFTFLILVSILFGFVMTTTMHYLPSDAKGFIHPLTGKWTQESGEEQQKNAYETLANARSANPVIQAVGWVQTGFYMIDLFLNIVLALPQMVTIFFAGIFSFAPIDPYLQSVLLTAILAISVIVYIIILLGVANAVRTGNVV